MRLHGVTSQNTTIFITTEQLGLEKPADGNANNKQECDSEGMGRNCNNERRRKLGATVTDDILVLKTITTLIENCTLGPTVPGPMTLSNFKSIL
jgi:hypothetical protein